MQFKLFSLLALATLAAATSARRGEPASDGATGDLQCCESTGTAKDPITFTSPILAAIGITVSDFNILVGLTCSPITVVGGGNALRALCAARTAATVK
ncbi:hypothetical protein PQX77_016492 [Marasmius sp. AFHP31]|nr:hypothetical protein PQX77_016492 [Marasmius sp. AFHP31]